MVGAYIARRLRKVEGDLWREWIERGGALRTRCSRKVEGHTPVGTSHDVTVQKVGRVPPVGTTRHVPINYRGVVIFGSSGGALRVTCRKNRGES